MKHLGGHLNITHVDEGSLLFLKNKFNSKSFLDIGCGPGGQVQLANKLGFNPVLGIDGDVQVKKENVLICDFTKDEASLNNQFDLCWSCEFLEHVEEKYISNFMPSFQACRIVALTHAPPNTKGHHHVNCRTSEYWIEVFEKYGFEFLKEETDQCRKASTMKRDFFRQNGLVFKNVFMV